MADSTALSVARYGALLAEHLYAPKVIESEPEYQKAKATLERLLFPSSRRLGAEEDSLAKLLMHLIEFYEEELASRRLAKGAGAGAVDVLRHLMDQRESRQRDLIGVIGTASMVSEVVNGKRRINAGQARRLAAYFGVSADLFL